MADVFVSYSRRDADFVQRMASSLEERGKSVWIDTQGIADTEVFPQALRSAIEGSDAFLFVITPDSVASDFCEQEVTYARSLEKRIVPALRAPVPDPAIPEEIRHRNWIPFTEAEDVDASLDRVVRALDTDLAACKEHTRWLVKALEWDAEDRDRSFLLRGSELKAAESWLAGTSPEAEPAPTTVQSEYVLASRRAAARRQRTLVTASLVVAVVAVGVGVVALVPRNQAVSAGRTDRVQALAAESQNELSADPEVSVLLARQAVQTDPDPQAVAALRQAVDASAVRVALPTQSGRQCGYLGAPSLAYSPDGHRLAESLCTGEVVVADAGPAASSTGATSPDSSVRWPTHPTAGPWRWGPQRVSLSSTRLPGRLWPGCRTMPSPMPWPTVPTDPCWPPPPTGAPPCGTCLPVRCVFPSPGSTTTSVWPSPPTVRPWRSGPGPASPRSST